MLNRIETQGALKSTVDYPVSVWKFNRDLAMVFLGGEVVAEGTPEDVASVTGSYTGRYLAPLLKQQAARTQNRTGKPPPG